ncbi:hypothetical protein [Thalassospira sp. MCCC 1A01428]|uniref:hypothetical protein n=1 Tax=Thalassospira sp. MCCC 1A01428 TaxID=1470575 RepID=UPI000A1DD645|nr:hypothetical protein [Thalassospira sp. MCCC 1A01428]OSQ42214.1 hypothetical protein THS27_15345 [Thalassospira sp. MCCC 1A01428]
MTADQTCPFPTKDADRNAIWDMLVPRDITAFVLADWSLVENDFAANGFYGIDAHTSANPDDWTLAFPDLLAYRETWLSQAHASQNTDYAEPLFDAVFAATKLEQIEINGDRALARKHFNGSIKKSDGSEDRLLWKTHYYCQKGADGKWRITGFIGYLPNNDV